MSLIADGPFAGLPRGHFGALLIDPPWHFQSWNGARTSGSIDVRTGRPFITPEKAPEYDTMSVEDMAALPIKALVSDDCALFLWGIWVMLPQALALVSAWGFEYKTCAFNWIKANTQQVDMFRDDADGQLGLGYWVRQNSEFCLLATRGKPKRLNADVRQGIIAPRREHSRKPDGIHGRIERLVAGPYIELFARQSTRPGWTFWGNQTEKFNGIPERSGTAREAPSSQGPQGAAHTMLDPDWSLSQARKNSAGCYATAIEALRRKREGG